MPFSLFRGPLRGVVSLLLFVSAVTAQSSWTGSVSSAWADPANWSSGVPTAASDAVVPAATPFAVSIPSGFVECRAMTVATGASISVSPGAELRVNGSLIVDGGIVGGGTVVMVGSSNVTLRGGPISRLEIAKTMTTNSNGEVQLTGVSGARTTTVIGDVVLTSGAFEVAASPDDRIEIGGDFVMTGGVLRRFNTGTIVASNIVHTNTSVTGTMPTIEFDGDWSNGAAFAPGSGSVVCNGASATLSGAPVRFPSLTVPAGASATTTAEFVATGAVSVAGSLALGSADASVAGDLTADGTLTHTSGVLSVSGSAALPGGYTGGGTLRMVGTANRTLRGGPIHRLEIAKTMTTNSNGEVQLTGVNGARTTTVIGDVVLTSGAFEVAANTQDRIEIGGDFVMADGVLRRFNIGTIVATNIVHTNTSVTGAMPTIEFDGDWSNGAAFAPSSGSVVCNGASATLSGAPVRFPSLTVPAGASATTTAEFVAAGAVSVAGSLALGSADASVAGDLTADGSLTHAGGVLSVSGSATLPGGYTGGGTLRMVGTANRTLRGGPINRLEIAKTMTTNSNGEVQLTGVNGARTTTVIGDVVLTSGAFEVAANTQDRIEIGGDFVMADGVLRRFNIGTIVATNIVHTNTSVTGAMPTIEFDGDWSNGASFAPSSGSVVCNGASATLSGAPVRFPSLTVPAGASATTTAEFVAAGAVSVAGSLALGSADASVAGDLTADGALTHAGGVLSVSGSATLPGGYTGGGTLRMVGTANRTLRGGPIHRLEIAKTMTTNSNGEVQLTGVNGARTTTVIGDVVLTSGAFEVAANTQDRIEIGGDFVMTDGVLRRFNIGTIVATNIVHTNTSVTGAMPTIEFDGDWSNGAAFAPSSGSVVCNGASATLSGAPVRFPSLTVPAGASATTTAELVASGNVSVAGSLALGSADASVSGDLTADGVLTHAGGVLSVSGSATLPGGYTGGGTLRMVGSTNETLRGGPINRLEIAKTMTTTSNGEVQLTGVNGARTTTVVGDVVLTSGAFEVAANTQDRIEIGGDFVMADGVLRRFNIGTIVATNIVHTNTSVTGGMPTIEVLGDWASTAAFAPSNGTVVFNGSGTLAKTDGGPLQFATARVDAGNRTVVGATLDLQADVLTIAAGATLDAAGAILTLDVPALAPAGALAVGPSGTLALPPIPISVQSSGSLVAIGVPGQPAAVTAAGAGRYGLEVLGTLAASNAIFTGLDANGLVVPADAVIAPVPNDLRSVSFADPAPTLGAVLLDITRSAPTTFWFSDFQNSASTSGVFNVVAPVSSAPITFANATGAFSGDAFENDPGDLISWTSELLTDLVSFTATPGVDEATLDWETAGEDGVAEFVLARGVDPAGPFTGVYSVAATGPGSYQFLDDEVEGGTQYYYQLSERAVGSSSTQVLDTVDVIPDRASTQLAFDTVPTTPVEAGQTWPDFTVNVLDAENEINTSATDTVTITVVTGPAIQGVLTQDAVDGVVTFSGLGATEAGTVVFDVNADGLTGILQVAVEVVPAPAVALEFDVAPALTLVAGGTLAPIVVRAVDPNGNVDTAFAGPVAVDVSGGTGSLIGTTPVGALDGLATFGDLSYETAESIDLTFSAAGLTPVQASLLVEPAAPTAIAFDVHPVDGTAGELLAPFTIEIRDQLGNLVADAPSESITLSVGDGTGQLLGTFAGTTSDGVLTFDQVRYEVAEQLTIRATSANYGLADADPITIQAADPAELMFVEEPGTLVYEGVDVSAFEVRIEDLFGNAVIQAAGTVDLVAPGLEGALAGLTNVSPQDGVATFAGLSFDTPQTVDVEFNYPALLPLNKTFVVAPAAADLRLASNAITVVPQGPAVSEPTVVRVDVANVGQINVDTAVTLYLGSVAVGNEIGTASAQIGVGGLTTLEFPWTPAAAGALRLYAVADNVVPAESTPADNQATRLVPVGAATEEIAVSAGERIVWPDATTTVGITLRNLGASITTLSSASTSSPWLTMLTDLDGVTLQPGASAVAVAELAVPNTAVGGPVGGEPVVTTIDVAVSTQNSNTYSGTLELQVFDQPTSSVTVTVVDARDNVALGGALVAFQELPGVFTTDAQGQVTAAVAPGSLGVAVYKQGFLARSVPLDVTNGAVTATVALEPGASLAIERVEANPVDAATLAQRGVVLDDPVNNVAFDFVVAMRVGSPVVLTNVEVPAPGPVTAPTRVTVRRTVTRSEPVPGRPIEPVGIIGTFDYLPGVAGRIETWIVIPGEILALKDFFEITATVVNRAETALPTDIQLRSVSASIAPLPTGLALPDLEGAVQLTTKSLPDLDAGETATIEPWIVRGDLPGTYQLEVATSADLFGFDTFLVNLTNAATTDLFEVTLPVLSCEFDTPGAVGVGQVFDFGVIVTNDSPSIARNVRVNLQAGDLENCRLSASQPAGAGLTVDPATSQILSASFLLGDLDPGETATATFQLVSELAGVIVERRITDGCQGNPSPGVTVAASPTLVTQPTSTTACEASSVSLLAQASGATPITYQWFRFDGQAPAPIAGATADTLVLSPLAQSDAGDYFVEVTNPAGTTLSDVATVTVQPLPVASFTLTPTSGIAPLTVQFTDTSTGTVDSWQWDLDGDGQVDSFDQHPSFVYTAAGNFTVTLTVGGGCGADVAAIQNAVQVGLPAPTAAFSGGPLSGPAPHTVAFADESTGAVTNWSWDFGDGSPPVTVASPQHTYAQPGTYTVSLEASGPGGTNTATRVGYVTVLEGVTAAFSGAPISGTSPLTVAFTDASTGATSWQWDFGDNTTSTDQNPSHVYESAGLYTVTLTATGPGGADIVVRGDYITVLPSITSFTVTPAAVTNGEEVELLAVFDGEGTIDNGIGIVQSGVARVEVPPFDEQTVYELTVRSGSNEVTATVLVESFPPAEIQSFVADPPVVGNGNPTLLTAVFSGAEQALVMPGNFIVESGVPITVVPPVDQTTSYVVSAVNPVGHVAASAVSVTSGAVAEITGQPTPQSVPAGAPASFTVAASGPGPLTYQWFRNGVPIANATGATLAIQAAQGLDAGDYFALVSNPFGSVASEVATLTVLGLCDLCNGGAVLVSQHVIADFNTTPPTVQAQASLLPYISLLKNGPDPEDWRMVIDTGGNRLVICPGVHVTTKPVPVGHRRPAPGIELRSMCDIKVMRCAIVKVKSRRAEAGAISIRGGGDVFVDGCVLNTSIGSGGSSGRITIASRCGDVRIRKHSLVFANRGSDIAIASGDTGTGNGGDIEITGRVRSDYRTNAPTVQIAAFAGEVRIDGRKLHWLSLGAGHVRTSGVVVRSSRRTAAAGRIEIQAMADVVVIGNTLGFWQWPNPGAVAIDMKGNHGGGVIDVRSIGGRILAFDRAFDNSNRANAYAINRLWAAGDIRFEALGGYNNVQPGCGWGHWQMPVADVGTTGHGTSGTNLVRSFSGGITLANPNTVLLARAWNNSGHPGLNLLTANTGVHAQGPVLPADPDGTDDAGVSDPPAPDALFPNAGALSVYWWW